MLRARIYEMELKKREAQAAAEQAAKTDIGWGHQIRSYVLQPYQMVKDLRTGVLHLRHRRRARRRPRPVHGSSAGAEGVRHRTGRGGGRGVKRRAEVADCVHGFDPRIHRLSAFCTASRRWIAGHARDDTGLQPARDHAQRLASSFCPARKNLFGSTASPRTRVS